MQVDLCNGRKTVVVVNFITTNSKNLKVKHHIYFTQEK